MEDGGIKESSQNLVSLTQDEFLSIAYDNPKELSVEEVRNIASDFLKALNKENESETKSSVSEFTLKIDSKSYYSPCQFVLSTKTASDEKLKLPVYEVEVTSNQGVGVVYISADERNAEVITYIPQMADNAELFVKSGSAFLVEWAKESAYEHLVEIEKARTTLHDATVTKISTQLGIEKSEVTLENVIDKIVVAGTRATAITTPTTQIIAKCDPIVKTEWSQGSPYNLSLPIPNAPSTQAHVYTGCAVTAACQLMTAIKPKLTLGGMLIDWDYLTQSDEVSAGDSADKLAMLGKLHSWVFDQLDATPQYDINGYHNGTGVSANSQVWFYGNYFNHSENYSKYDPDALLRSFRAGYPSLIRGQGHAWIVDGYIIAEKAVASSQSSTRAIIIQYYDMFWHANLGWGGLANGYYKLKPDAHVDFESVGYTFTTDGLYIYPGLYSKVENLNF